MGFALPHSSASLSSSVWLFLREGERSQPRQRHGEGFPKDKANSSASSHRVLSHTPRGLSCCSRPAQHRLFTWHCGRETAAGMCTRSCRSTAVPTNRFTRELRPPRGDKRTRAATVTPPGTDREPLHVLWGRKLLGIHQAIQGSLLRLRSLRPIGIF